MRKSEDDPALQIPASREMSGVHVDQFRSEPDRWTLSVPRANAERWQTKWFIQRCKSRQKPSGLVDGKVFATHDVVSLVKRTLYNNPDGQFRSRGTSFRSLCSPCSATPTAAFDAPGTDQNSGSRRSDVYFIVDVAFNFITGFWKDMETTTVLISDAKEIALNYLRTVHRGRRRLPWSIPMRRRTTRVLVRREWMHEWAVGRTPTRSSSSSCFASFGC